MGVTSYDENSSVLTRINNQSSASEQKADTTPDGALQSNIYGTYIHGIFDSEQVRTALMSSLYRIKGMEKSDAVIDNHKDYKEKQYDLLAQTIRESLNMEEIYRIMDEGISV